MPMENWRMVSDPTDRRRSPRLSVLIGMAPDAPSRYPATRSPRNFDPGAVGLGIVAAMSEPARSEPIPIISGRAARPVRREEEEDDDDDETMLLESYTCVISHAGGNPVRKRVYLDDGCGGMGGNYARSWGLSFEPPPTTTRIGPPAPASDFLSRCYLCKKRLHGLDIFMYRGEMAFCSAECRCQQIVNEEQQRGSEARKPFACSVSPCSTTTPTTLTFAAGLVAA